MTAQKKVLWWLSFAKQKSNLRIMATMLEVSADASELERQTYGGDIPASPTASLCEQTHKFRRRSLLKRVSFSADVKPHDGLTPRNHTFDKLVTMYFVEQREVSELDVLAISGNEIARILELHEDLMDMTDRINQAVAQGRQCAPVLPRGGGMCTKLVEAHLPYIRVLDRVVEAAANRAILAHRRKEGAIQHRVN